MTSVRYILEFPAINNLAQQHRRLAGHELDPEILRMFMSSTRSSVAPSYLSLDRRKLNLSEMLFKPCVRIMIRQVQVSSIYRATQRICGNKLLVLRHELKGRFVTCLLSHYEPSDALVNRRYES